jgi:hypothetical protein
VLVDKSLDCSSHEPRLTKNRGSRFHCGVQRYFRAICPILKHKSTKSSNAIFVWKHSCFLQQQFELINSKLDFLTNVISDKYPSAFVDSQE